MEEQRNEYLMVKRRTPVLNGYDLFLEIISCWRGILLWAIIGIIVFGVIGFALSYAESKKIGIKSMEELDAEGGLNYFESRLSPEEKTDADDALLNFELLMDNENVIQTSPLFHIDSDDAPLCKLTLRIVLDENNNGYGIAPEYSGIINSAEMREYLGKNCEIESDLSKIIGVDECSGDIIGMYFYNTSEDKCIEMADCFIEYINEKSKPFQQSFSKHHFDVLNKATSKTFSSFIASAQKEYNDRSYNYEKKIDNYMKNFSVDQIYYFKLKLKEKYGDGEEIKRSGIEFYEKEIKEKNLAKKNGEDKAGVKTEDNESESPIKHAIKTSAKMGVLGVVVFAFIYIIIVGYRYALSSKINDVDELSDLYNIKSFGKIYREGKHTLPLDKAISKARRRGRELVPEEVATSVIVENAVNEAKENGVKSVAIIGVGEGTAIANSVSEKLSADSVNAFILEKPMQNPEELKKLEGVDSAIVLAKPKETCYCEIWDELELLANRGIKVLGGAVI